MGQDSKIEWTHHTFNPWIGCEKVSPACQNCYAEELNKRFRWVEWGAGKPRREANPSAWGKALRWSKTAQDAGRRDRVFCASLADVLDPNVPRQWLDEVLRLVQQTREGLDWLLLTKREEELQRIPSIIRDVLGVKEGILPNLWVGVTAENNEFWERRVPRLMDVPAVVRFVSVEPMLGPITLGDGPVPDWIIAGGESGPRARSLSADWVRSLRERAKGRSAFLFKQWGGVDKVAAGRVLDGEILDAYPTPRQIPVTVE